MPRNQLSELERYAPTIRETIGDEVHVKGGCCPNPDKLLRKLVAKVIAVKQRIAAQRTVSLSGIRKILMRFQEVDLQASFATTDHKQVESVLRNWLEIEVSYSQARMELCSLPELRKFCHEVEERVGWNETLWQAQEWIEMLEKWAKERVEVLSSSSPGPTAVVLASATSGGMKACELSNDLVKITSELHERAEFDSSLAAALPCPLPKMADVISRLKESQKRYMEAVYGCAGSGTVKSLRHLRDCARGCYDLLRRVDSEDGSEVGLGREILIGCARIIGTLNAKYNSLARITCLPCELDPIVAKIMEQPERLRKGFRLWCVQNNRDRQLYLICPLREDSAGRETVLRGYVTDLAMQTRELSVFRSYKGELIESRIEAFRRAAELAVTGDTLHEIVDNLSRAFGYVPQLHTGRSPLVGMEVLVDRLVQWLEQQLNDLDSVLAWAGKHKRTKVDLPEKFSGSRSTLFDSVVREITSDLAELKKQVDNTDVASPASVELESVSRSLRLGFFSHREDTRSGIASASDQGPQLV